jgi:hypothetical protein
MEDRQLKEIRQHFERMKKLADGMRMACGILS